VGFPVGKPVGWVSSSRFSNGKPVGQGMPEGKRLVRLDGKAGMLTDGIGGRLLGSDWCGLAAESPMNGAATMTSVEKCIVPQSSISKRVTSKECMNLYSKFICLPEAGRRQI
jgi:hypothetical protein